MGGSSSSSSAARESPNDLVSDSLIRILDLVCEGPISGWALQSGIYGGDPLCSTYFNDVVVRNTDGSYNYNISGQGFLFATTLGTANQVPISGFEYVTTQIPMPPDTRLSNPPSNAGLPKNVIVTFNTNQYPDAAAVIINFSIPEMFATDPNGNTNGFEVDVETFISLNNGPFTSLDNGVAFVGKNTTPYFRTYEYALPVTTPPSSFYQWTLMFTKQSQDVQSVQVADDIYVDSVSVISASQYRYPNSVMAGTYCDALQFGSIPARAYLIQGLLLSVPSGYTPTTYNPDGTITPAVYPNIWDGNLVTGVWTDNPAWIFYDLVTNTRYGLGQYINTANIDIWSLYQVSQYCDMMVDNGQGNGLLEPQFTCNVAIQDPQNAYNMLLDLASSFRGMLYYANGTIRANLTDDKTPVFNYTNANVINGAFNYTSTSRSARHNVVQVKYTDPQNLYRENYILLEDNQGIVQYGYNKKEIATFGCTSLGQATRVGNWILTTERLRTETVTFQVGFDGLYIRPGDVFNLYDNFRMNRSQGGRVAGFDPTQQFVTLDRTVNLDSGCIYALSCLVPTFNYDATGDITGSNQIPLLRNPQIQSCVVLNADISGVSTLQVSGGFSGLMKNSVWVLSATGVYTSGYIPTVFEQAPQYECLSIMTDTPGILSVLALNYNTGINYSINTGFSTIFNPINSGNAAVPLPVTNLTGQYITGALVNGSFFAYYNLTWSASLSSSIGGYAVSGDQGTSVYSQLGTTTLTGFRYINSTTGNVDFKVVTLGNGGARSAPQSLSFSFPTVPGVDTNQIRFWELPAGFGDLEQVGMFYNRPYPSVTNTAVFFATGKSAPFREVMNTANYSVLGVSQSGISTSGTTIYFNTNSYDIPTISSQSAGQQAANNLLFLINNELMSVGTVTGLTSTQYAFTASRAVLGTFATTHAANTSGWMIYANNIPTFTDASLVQVFNATGYDTGVAARYFQIQNNTANLEGAIVPVAPGISYTLPDPLPAAPTNLSGIVGTGKIVRLTWTAPLNDNIIDYNVYRATGPSYTDQTGIASTVNTFYDDIAVVLGTTYEYWVASVNQEEQISPLSASVFETPQLILPSGISPYPPADPTAITLNGSGNYFSSDGSLLAYMSFNVPVPTSGTAYQNLVFQRHGISTTLTGAQIGAQVSYTGATTATIYDLSPNVSYDFGSQSISNFGQFSADVVYANGSPITAPYSTTVVNAPGSPPSTPSGLVVSGGLGGTANFIALSWLPNAEPNFEEYGVYRNTTNSAPTTPIANVGSNSFIDGNVTGAITYYYWLSAFNRNEQQSALSASASASTENPPSTPTAPTLNASGAYYGAQGNAFSYLTFNINALPSGAVGQYLLYRPSGTASYTVGNDVANTITTTATISDLTPGIYYDIGVQAYSLNGISTAIITGVGSPYPAPSITGAPQPPTSIVGINPATYTGNSTIAPQYSLRDGVNTNAGALIPAIIASWTPSVSTGLAYYDIAFGPNINPLVSPPGVLFSVPPSTTSATVYLNGFAYNGGPLGFTFIRAVDRFGNVSTWNGVSNTNFSAAYAGNVGYQNVTGVNVQQITGTNAVFNGSTGNNHTAYTFSGGQSQIHALAINATAVSPSMAIGPSTARPVLVQYPLQYSYTVGAGSSVPSLYVKVPIPSSAGFTVKPDLCSSFCINNQTTANSDIVNLNYVATDTSGTSTSTQALIQMVNQTSTQFANGQVVLMSLDFTEYT